MLLGLFLQTAIFLFGGYGMVIRHDSANNVMKEQITGIQSELKQLAAIMIKIAVQSERQDAFAIRLNMLDQRMDDLRHGRGWVEKDDRQGLSGEYR